jgi:hypothetical protein
MGRNHGPKKFSFPLPRRSRTKVDDDNHDNDDARSTPSMPSAPEWSSRREESSSKAHRVLGTSDGLYPSTSGQASKTPIPAGPGYMSITVSEASFGSQMDDRTSAIGAEKGYSKRPGMSKRPSSNILGRMYSAEGARSDNSSISHRLQPQTSNSTLRSHYDAKSSPLSISQQTSDSAVRDRALRRGQPPVLTDHGYQDHAASPISPAITEQSAKENRKSKPARLDLSRLFPKPKGGETHEYGNALLSPTKMVSSPAAMSMVSEYFPRPMTREPIPEIGGQVKLKSTTQHQNPMMQPPSSPVRKFKRDDYDNAKVNVRRPPKGVKYWFDALDEDSDEVSDHVRVPIHPPTAVRPQDALKIPARKASLERLTPKATTHQDSRSNRIVSGFKRDTFSHEDIVDVTRLTSPSEFSLNTQHSHVSTKTKESAISKTNLQDSSVLSFSSSEDECDSSMNKPRKFAVRKSLDSVADAGEIVIGQAEAFEVRQHRRPSVGMMSTRTTSTTAATIEVMYTPEPPFPPYHYSRRSDYSGSRRSSHVRQPSVIHEDEDFRPKTAINAPLSPSSRSVVSARTSTSEPQPRTNGSRKLMAVTAEEEALLELMRKKRAAMAKMGANQVETVPLEQHERRTPPREGAQQPYRTSGFLSMEASPPARVVENKGTRRSSAIPPSPLLLPPRGRPISTTHEGNVAMSHLRDSSASDTWSDRHNSPVSRGRLPHYLPTPSEFSPLDPFPPTSPTPTASAVSPTTTEHASPLPSPITPGLRFGAQDVNVKVANSDTSNELDDIIILDNGVIGNIPDGRKSDSSYDKTVHHQRRRTASSDAEVNFPVPPTSVPKELASVSEASSRPPSTVEPPLPKIPKRNSKRIGGATLSPSTPARSRQSSVHSNTSRNSSYSQSSSVHNSFDKRSARHVSSGNSVTSSRRSPKDDRNSVNDDVLAAWNSLGGTY